MLRHPPSPPSIIPLSSNEIRPLWSVMIPVYNCSQYIPDVIESVMARELGEAVMQIEVVDDASTDADVEEIVKRVGKGRVGYFRQEKNVGSLRNFETCINRSKGELIHLLHGDDCIKEGFYQELGELFECYPQAGAAFCNYNFINTWGEITHTNPPESNKREILDNWLIRIAARQRIQYVAMVVRREVYEDLGSFYGVTYGEDWEMWVRIAKYYQVAYTPKVLAQYRSHENSITWSKVQSGKVYSDLLFVVNAIKEHLPEKARRRTFSKARLEIAFTMLGIIYKNLGNTHGCLSTMNLIRKTLSLSKHPLIISHVINVLYKIAKEKIFYSK